MMPGFGGVARPNPFEIVALRCKACSAPLSAKPSEDMVKCESCGTTQKLVDARAFLDQILLQVNAWVRQAIPLGAEAVASGLIDPIARHSVFINNVRPRLTTEYGEYRFNCYNVLSRPLMVLPMMSADAQPVPNHPSDVFLFQAKVQSVAPLAVDEETKGLVGEINGLCVTYGYILNNVGLMSSPKPERYHLMASNFEAAAESLRGLRKFVGLSERLKGLAKLSAGLDRLTSLQAPEAAFLLDQARGSLQAAREVVSRDFEMAVILQAIDKELSITNSSIFLVEAGAASPVGGLSTAASPLRRLLELLGAFGTYPYAQWQARFRDVGHHEQVLALVATISRAKAGSGSLNILPGYGAALFPFWAVDVPYTFQTGALWRTQGVEVTEALLVAATFPLDGSAFSGSDPSAVLTDVFRARERSGMLKETLKRVSGKETSISGGGPVRDLINRSQPLSVAGLVVVPPLATGQDAAGLVQAYIARARELDPAVQKQLRLSSPRVIGLFFAPGVSDGGRLSVMPELGSLAPRSIGDLSALRSIAL